jgi:hypothetical protein
VVVTLIEYISKKERLNWGLKDKNKRGPQVNNLRVCSRHCKKVRRAELQAIRESNRCQS